MGFRGYRSETGSAKSEGVARSRPLASSMCALRPVAIYGSGAFGESQIVEKGLKEKRKEEAGVQRVQGLNNCFDRVEEQFGLLSGNKISWEL